MNASVRKMKSKERRPIDKDKARTVTCIVCPTCCELETDGVEVNGARCVKGEAFARQEVLMPLRVVTTSVRCETPEGARMIPVRTAAPVAMAQIFEIMKSIKALSLSRVPDYGSVIRVDTGEESVDLIVTGE
jgi:CxxC motif-containing protein